jgi:hypothetical protein
MVRYHHNVYAVSARPNYVVLFDSQRQVIESRRLEPHSDLRKAITDTIGRLRNEGWQFEGTPEFGFVFLNRDGIRRLLTLTERDPSDTRAQSFSPFK